MKDKPEGLRKERFVMKPFHSLVLAFTQPMSLHNGTRPERGNLFYKIFQRKDYPMHPVFSQDAGY